MSVEKISKPVNKIEIFRPKRKFLAPVNPNYFVRKGEELSLNVAGIKLTIKNTRTQNVYVRIK